MNPLAIAFLLLNIIAIFRLPKRWACVPLLLGSLYITNAQNFEIAGAKLTLTRVLILMGGLRVVSKREQIAGGVNLLDRLMIAWAIWIFTSSLGHRGSSSDFDFIFRGGLVLDYLGIYFLFRVFLSSFDDVVHLLKVIAIIFLPIALEMIHENLTHRNLFSYFGGVSETPGIRNGRLRAQGPFRHAILAGTVGALIVPLMVGLWSYTRRLSVLGVVCGLTMVVACASSGPIMSLGFSLFALTVFWYRQYTRLIRWTAFGFYALLEIVMSDPAYYVIAKIDVAGGSTGWHRARLIESSIEHLNEWWWMGTNYTRHWMTSGVSWSQNHSDITNYYIKMGVWGGIPLMVIFMLILMKASSFIGKTIQMLPNSSVSEAFLVWTLGASLFSIITTAISVSFFDQSFVFVYMVIAIIGSVYAIINQSSTPQYVAE